MILIYRTYWNGFIAILKRIKILNKRLNEVAKPNISYIEQDYRQTKTIWREYVEYPKNQIA